MSPVLVIAILALSVLTWVSPVPVAAANDTVHVTVTPVRQTDVVPGGGDPGTEDCLPASVAMALEVFKTNGTIPDGVTVTYPFVRASFRKLVPTVSDPLYLTVAVSQVPGLTQDTVAADIIEETSSGWPDLVYNQISRQTPVVALIGNWSLLKNGTRQLHTSNTGHYVTVTGIGPDQVTFIDPWDGKEYPMTRADFGVAWQSASWTALVFTNQSPDPNAPPVPTLVSPADGTAVAPAGIVLQWSDVGAGLKYEVEAWERRNDSNWLHPEPAWQSATAWVVPWKLDVGPTYMWRARAQNVDGQVSPWSTPWTFNVDATLPPPTAVAPSAVIPSGAWISPGDGTTLTSAPLHLVAHAYTANPGDPPIDHVSFSAWWPALGPDTGPWQPACSVPASAAQGDVYGCDWSLQGAPPGQVKVSFDVYDQAGNNNTAPNGVRTLQYQPSTGLIAYVGQDMRSIWAIRRDGTDNHRLVQLTDLITNLTWSPDGRLLAYDATPAKEGVFEAQIQVLDIATGQNRKIQVDAATHGPIAFFPDGRKLAAIGQGTGEVGVCSAFVLSVDLDSGKTVQLADTPCVTGSLHVTPGGRSLIVATGGEWVVRLERISVPSGSHYVLPTIAQTLLAAVSNDGTKLAYIAYNPPSRQEPDKIVVANTDGTAARIIYQLPRGLDSITSLSFSSDQSQLVFGVDNMRGAGQPTVWVINTDGTDYHAIAPGRYPAWQPIPSK